MTTSHHRPGPSLGLLALGAAALLAGPSLAAAEARPRKHQPPEPKHVQAAIGGVNRMRAARFKFSPQSFGKPGLSYTTLPVEIKGSG